VTVFYEQLRDIEQRMDTFAESQSTADMPRINTSCENVSTALTNGDNPLLEKPRPVLVQSTEVRNSGSVSIPPFTSNYNQKLPHPLSHFLEKLPIVDGSDIMLL
jgi:hypothetical protein